MSKQEQQEEPKTVKVWKTSIPKAELALLPAEVFTGNITVVSDEASAEAAASVLSKAELIGFDTETRPSFRRGEHHNVALLQLSTPEECFLFRLNVIGLPDSIRAILEDDKLMKIGLSIKDDFISLNRKFQFEPRNFVDLQTFVKEFGIADNSLSRIYGILFDKRISKGQRLTNWEAAELTRHQHEYAALDALACITIDRHLRDNGFDHTTSKYYREYEEPAN